MPLTLKGDPVTLASRFLASFDITETLLIGSVADQEVLQTLHDLSVERLSSLGVYDSYFDTVFTGELDLEEDPDTVEIAEANAQEHINQVVFFDSGLDREFDVGVRLAPFIYLGIPIIIITSRIDNTFWSEYKDQLKVFQTIEDRVLLYVFENK